MLRRVWARLVLALTVAALFSAALPVLADSSWLISPKPEKKWMEYLYRANGAAPGVKPSTLLDGGTAVGFNFPLTPDTSLFTTKHPAYNDTLLGDLTGKSVSADIEVTAAGPFNYYGQGTSSNPCGTPATVRLYFTTTNPDLGYSQYWWSNDQGAGVSSHVLTSGTTTLTAALLPANWSNWNGQFGTTDPTGFAAAVADVQEIGLSFGGGCFFANGVGNSSGAGFELTSLTVTP